MPAENNQGVECADKNLIVRNSQMSPCGSVTDMAFRNLRELCGVGINEPKVAAFIQCKQLRSVGGHAPVFADRSGACLLYTSPSPRD